MVHEHVVTLVARSFKRQSFTIAIHPFQLALAYVMVDKCLLGWSMVFEFLATMLQRKRVVIFASRTKSKIGQIGMWWPIPTIPCGKWRYSDDKTKSGRSYGSFT